MDSLTDIREIIIDKHASSDERLRMYLEQIKNPCLFRVGEITVSLQFQGDSGDLQEILLRHFHSFSRKEILDATAPTR